MTATVITHQDNRTSWTRPTECIRSHH